MAGNSFPDNIAPPGMQLPGHPLPQTGDSARHNALLWPEIDREPVAGRAIPRKRPAFQEMPRPAPKGKFVDDTTDSAPADFNLDFAMGGHFFPRRIFPSISRGKTDDGVVETFSPALSFARFLKLYPGNC